MKKSHLKLYIILAISISLLMIISDTMANVQIVDNPVDANSNIDSNLTLGDVGGTIANAQTLDASSQSINETNVGEEGEFIYTSDSFSSNVDGIYNRGTLNPTSGVNSLDSNYASLSENTSEYSADMTGGYFLVGGGTTDFRSSAGTIEMWVKFDLIAGRMWGQDNNFEGRFAGTTYVLDFGIDNTLTGTKTDWVADTWYYFAISWDQGASTIYTYWGDETTSPTIDGSNSTWVDPVTSTPLVENNIMASKGGTDPMDGHVDEFRYWNVAMDQNSLTSRYNVTLLGDEANLQNYYQFENSLLDLAGSSDLTASGSYSFSTDVSTDLTQGYYFNQEIQFANEFTSFEFEEVNLYLGSTGTENLGLYYWVGSSWTTIASDLSNAWNNFTIDIVSTPLVIKLETSYSISDNIQDVYQLDYIELRLHGRGLYEVFVDDNTSDIDSSFDKGTHSNFNNELALDGTYDSIIEQRAYVNDYVIGSAANGRVLIGGSTTTSWGSSTGTISFWTKIDSFGQRIWGQESNFAIQLGSGGDLRLDIGANDEVISSFSLTAGKWYFIAVTWNEPADILRLYIGDDNNAPTLNNEKLTWTATASDKPNNGNNFLGAYGGQQIDAEGDDLRYYNTDRSLSEIQSDYNIELVGSESNLRAYYKFENNLLDSGPLADHSSSAGTFYYATNTPSGYIERKSRLDLEFSFNNNPYTTNLATLAIYTGTLPAEILLVDYWNGFIWVNVLSSLSSNSWNNATISGYATNTPITFRYRDGDTTDLTQSTWQIDAVLLKFVNYNLDWEHQVTSVDTSREHFELTIYGQSSDSESFYVQMWDTIGLNWVTAFSTKISSTAQWYNFTLTSPNTISSTMTWRYTGDKEISDSQITTLSIDYAAIHAYDIAPTFTSNPNNLSYNEDVTGSSISWTATDENPGTYIIQKNGSIVVSSTAWTDLTPIVYNVDGQLKGTYNYTIILQDVNGNLVVDTVILTILDSTNPNFISTPSDIEYNETTTGNSISWTANDTYAGTYILYRDDIQIDNNNWINGNPLNFNIDGLSQGSYQFSLFVFDASGNFILDNATVTVHDVTDPVITVPQNNTQYSEGSTPNSVSWTATDSHPGTYTLYRNGSVIVTDFSWTSGNPVIRNIDGLSTGAYNFTIEFLDSSGNTVISTAFITVFDDIPPNINSPSDVNYFEGTTGNKITWTISDAHPNTFTVYRNSTALYTFAWQSGTLDIPIDGRTIGFYNFTLLIRDKSGNTNEDSVIVHVTDNTNPSLNSPSSFSYTEGTTNHFVSWVATDLHPATYSIFRNGTEIVSSQTWSSGNQISSVIDGLSKNVYNFTIIVFDNSGNSNTQTLFVSVLDGTDPIITHPPNFSYIEGVGGNSITWTATDSYAGLYTLYIDDIETVVDRSWASGVGITENVNGLLKGTHNMTISVSDASGNSVVDTVIITVNDGTNPVITPQSDQIYTEGTTGHSVIWTVSDAYPGTYKVFRDGVQVQTGSWTTSVTNSIDGMTAGVHNVTLRIYDASGNTVANSINVTVNDLQNPSVSDVGNFSYGETSTGNTIIWTASDLHPGTYEVYRDLELISSGAWTSNIVINIDGLVFGSYDYRIDVYDASSNLVQDYVTVTVIDTTNPILNSPSNIDYSFGLTGNAITWTATDLHAANYTIYLDLTQFVKTGTWISGQGITINIDGLSVGDFNYTLLVEDSSGNQASDLVNVKVTAQPVIVNSPGNYHYIEGATGNQLSWTVSDGNPQTYIIYRTNQSQSEEILESGTWLSQTLITRNIDGLPIGIYNYTIYLNDTDGFFVVDMLNVTVSDLPLFDAPFTSDYTYEYGSTGNTITWNATDMFPDTYFIYLDGVLNASGSWNNSSAVIFDVDGLDLGTYNHTIVFLDTVGNQISDTVFISVEDTAIPIFSSSTGDISYDENSTGNSLTWTFTDSHAYTYTIRRNGTVIASGSWSSGVVIVLPNIDGLTLGFYGFVINVTDSSGNFLTSTIVVHVVDGTTPFVNSPADIPYYEGETGPFNLSWTGTDYHPIGYNITRNGVLVDQGTWINGVPINYDATGLLKGIYTFEIILNDTGENWVSDTVIITVEDNTNPLLTSPALDIDINEGTLNVNVTWTFTDNYADQYTIELDGVENVSLTPWISAIPINYTLDGIVRGNYNFTIIIYDLSGNFVTDTILVSIHDVTNPDVNDVTDFTVNEGINGNTIDWTIGDIHPDNYTITRDGVPIFSGVSWTNTTLMVSLNGLEKGSYLFTITVYDDTGNFATDSVTVDVIDVVVPIITDAPLDGPIVEGTTGNVLEWTASDINNNLYNITRNGVEIASGSWSSNITINIDGLPINTYTYILYINDTSGNEQTDTVIITVEDRDLPIITDLPINFSYVEGDTNIQINWTITDIHAGLYTITNNSVFLSGGSWTTGVPIVQDITGMPFGTYNFTITVNDTSGNTVQDFVIVTVYDSQDPTVNDVVGPIVYSEGITSNIISWTMNDLNNYSYSIFRNGSLLVTANYSNGVPVDWNIDGLTKGFYLYSITVYDLSGNSAIDTVIVQVIDTTSPVIFGPGTSSYNEGGSTSMISWTITENYKSTYHIFQNGSEIVSGNWNTVMLNYNVPTLQRGYYNFTALFIDKSGNQASNMVIVHVIDVLIPSVTNLGNVAYSEGTLISNVNWVALDIHPGTYIIYRNGSQTAINNWTSGAQIVYNVGGLPKGIHNITILVQDDTGNSKSDQFWVTVTDDTLPVITRDEFSIYYYEGDTNNNITWLVTDLHPNNYTITKDGSPFSSGIWTSVNNITENIDGELLGSYLFNLTIYDASGNHASHIVTLQVREITPPVFNSQPNNSTYVEGTTGHILVWNSTDTYPNTYSITRNGSSLIGTTAWSDNQNITLPIDGLSAGIYTYVITIKDTSANTLQDVVQITVLDQKNPSVTKSSDFTYESGTTDAEIIWSPVDLHPSTYIFYRDNNTVLTDVIWTSGQPVLRAIPKTISLGLHNYTIEFFDKSGNSNVSTVFVNVVDTINPGLVSAPVLSLALDEGEIRTIMWTFSDANPDTYIVQINQVTLPGFPATWTSNIPIQYNFNRLIGNYNLTIIVTDKTGQTGSNTISVTVSDNYAPKFQSTPSDVTLTEGNSNVNLAWTMDDENPAYAGVQSHPYQYFVYLNGSEILNDTWLDNAARTYNLATLSKGVYNLTFVITDVFGNSQSHQTIITIVDLTLPVITANPNFPTYIEGSTGNSLTWKAIDLYPSNYTLYRNGVAISEGIWASANDLTINIDGLMTGTFTFTMEFSDESGNSISDSEIIEVIDITPPELTQTPVFSTFLDNNPASIQWIAIDNHAAHYTLLQNGDPFRSRTWVSGQPIKVDLITFNPGYYEFSMSIYDASGLSVNHTVTIRIKDPNIIDTLLPDVEIERSVYEGDIEIIASLFEATADRDVSNPIILGGVSNAKITLDLYKGDEFIRPTEFFTDSNGLFNITFDYDLLGTGIYTWKISYFKLGYLTQETEIEVSVKPHSYFIKFDIPPSLRQGDGYDFVVRISYNDRPGGLSFDELSSRQGTPVIGVNVIATIEYQNPDGTIANLILSKPTDINGNAIFRLSGSETAQISKILGISAKVEAGSSNNEASNEYQTPNIIEINPPLPTLLDRIIDWVLVYYLVILGMFGLILLFAIITGLFMRRRRERLKVINKGIRNATEELEAIQGLKAIIVQTSDKLTVFEELVFETTLNTSLIGGMISAFSSFLSEITSDQVMGFEMMEREGANITVHKGRDSNFIVISETKVPIAMLTQIQRAQQKIESDFKQYFSETERGVRKLTKVQVYPIFDQSLFKLSLTELLSLNERNIGRILKLKTVSRALKRYATSLYDFPKSKYVTDGTFYLEDMISYLEEQSISHEILCRIVILAWEFNVVSATVQEQTRVDSQEELFDALDPYDFSDLNDQ